MPFHLQEMIAVQVDQLSAVHTFQMEMIVLAATAIILKTGASAGPGRKFLDYPFGYQLFQIAVYRGAPYRGSLFF